MNVPETIEGLLNWLHLEGVQFRTQHAFIDAYCDELRDRGLPIDRVFIVSSIVHPLLASKAYVWRLDEDIYEISWTREQFRLFQTDMAEQAKAEANNAPLYQLMIGAKFVRIKATDEDLPEDLSWMRTDGYTELYGLPVPSPSSPSSPKDNLHHVSRSLEGALVWSTKEGGHLEGAFTWSTKQEGGFTEDEIIVLNRTVAALSVVLRLYIVRFSSMYLLQAYLGEDAGSRVHNGEIERGEGLTIRSVIWFSDVRGFTKMSRELNHDEVIDIINGVFEATHNVVRKYKGQVLKFMGDGCMAIFSSGSTTFQKSSFSSMDKFDLDEKQGAKTCQRARMAAMELHEELERLKIERKTKGLHCASVGVGLHYGDVSYGNVGAPDRLDFTVLGPHVNLASRTESLCSKLGAEVLATSDFVELDDAPGAWTSRGEHEVKGVADPVPIFELVTTLGSESIEKDF